VARLKIDNGLYFHVRSMLNAILPLEYTIRAFRSEFSQQFLELKSIKIGGGRSYRKDAVNVVVNYYPEPEREQRISLIEKNYKDIQKKIKFIMNNARIRQTHKQLEFSDSPIVYHNVME